MVRHEITYTCGNGRVFDLSLPRVAFNSNDLFGYEWASETYGLARTAREYTAQVAFLQYPDRATAVAYANDFASAMVYDMDDVTIGTLTVDGWSLDCYARASQLDARDYGQSKYAVTFRAPDPTWRRPNARHVGIIEGSDTNSLNFPFNLETNIGSSLSIGGSLEFSLVARARVVARFYGPCTDPYLMVKSGLDSVLVGVGGGASCTNGETITINPYGVEVVGSSIFRADAVGNRHNLFNMRRHGTNEEPFPVVPAGDVLVTAYNCTIFDVVMWEEAPALPWI